MNKYFSVNVKAYDPSKDFEVYCPSSLDKPENNSVMFVMERYAQKAQSLFSVKECLVFWKEGIPVPEEIKRSHAVVEGDKPRVMFCQFFAENGIRCLPEPSEFDIIGGATICRGAKIGAGSVIMPNAYIGPEVELGENAYIGAGACLVGKIKTGRNLIVRENTVIGADGLTTDRDETGKGVTMPQFGRVILGDNIIVGANVTIARGAIDDTIINSGCKLDNSTYVSHNVVIGKDTLLVGETMIFGSATIGERVLLSGNSTIRNKVSVGSNVTVGMGSVVIRNIPDDVTVVGNPTRVIR